MGKNLQQPRVAQLYAVTKRRGVTIGWVGILFEFIQHINQHLGIIGVASSMDERIVVDVGHLLMVSISYQVVKKLKVTVSDRIHHGRPLVGREHSIDELGIGLEELDNLLCLSLLNPTE